MIFLLFLIIIIFLFNHEIDNFIDNVFSHEKSFLSNMKNTNTQKINLNDIQQLTFKKNRYTTGFRTNPIKQLNCVGGNACDHQDQIDEITCYNNGLKNESVIWKCNTNLSNDFTISDTTINCEGYTSEYDKFKLNGSCGLEYVMNKNEKYKINLKNILIIAGFLVFIMYFFLSKENQNNEIINSVNSLPILSNQNLKDSSLTFPDSSPDILNTSIVIGSTTTR